MKRITISAIAVLASVAAYAQAASETASVNDYIKGEVLLATPDSLQAFDYHFDYSVFDSPYKGAYEFTPYFVKITPEKSVLENRVFSLRAGAGYTFHPELEFIWTPVRTDAASFSVYNSGSGYAGSYIAPFSNWEEWSGYDFSDSFGFSLEHTGKKNFSSLDGGWTGIFTNTPDFRSGFNALKLNFGIRPREDTPTSFYYRFNVGYSYGNDSFHSDGNISDHNVSLTGCVGPVLGRSFRFLVDFAAQAEILKDGREGFGDYTGVLLDATPRLVFSLGPVKLDAGLAVDFSKTDRGFFSLSPKITASVGIVPDKVQVYAGFVGGQKFNSYTSIKEANHFNYRAEDSWIPLATMDRMNAYGGVKCTIGGNLDLDLKGGYVTTENAALPYIRTEYADVAKVYVSLLARYRSDRLDFDLDFELAPKRWLYSGTAYGSPFFKGDVNCVYNWNRRIFAGVTLQASSIRRSNVQGAPVLPWYISPGVLGEYRFSKNLGVWLKGGNLLGHKIYDVPGYMTKGPYFTVGVSCCL